MHPNISHDASWMTGEMVLLRQLQQLPEVTKSGMSQLSHSHSDLLLNH